MFCSFEGPILEGFWELRDERKKACIHRPLKFQASLHKCGKKAFEENPLFPGGQSLLASESPIK